MPEGAIAILGPTASGKSLLAVAVALRTGGSVVNGDPFQAYRDLPVGTGQPREEERGGAPTWATACCPCPPGSTRRLSASCAGPGSRRPARCW